MSTFWHGRGIQEGRWRSKLITASTTFVVPADVSCLWMDACGGGGGGGGGNSTPGGGGAGGNPGIVAYQVVTPVTPGETVTLTVGAGGAGGAANNAGVAGGASGFAGALASFVLPGGLAGGAGQNPNGGNGSYTHMGVGNDGVAGGAGAGTFAQSLGSYGASTNGCWMQQNVRMGRGAPGGAFGFSGGQSASISGGSPTAAGTSTTGQPGGGGGGGNGIYGVGGAGGSNGAAGSAATGYGAGGGGGSGSSAGGAGSPGMVRIYCLTAYAI